MGRPVRIEYVGALYHISSRGNERKKIFLDVEDRIRFLNLLREYHDRYGILIHSYVLMDNHYHLILETPMGNLLKVMHGINGGYTGYFNRKYKRVGHLFQGRYRAILVEKESYLLPLSRYVHLNPVRAGLVRRPEGYRWSSYRGYIGREREEDWVEYAWALSQFAESRKRGGWRYKAYVEEGLKGELESPLKSVYGQVVLGGGDFVQRIKGVLKGRLLSAEIIDKGGRANTPRKVVLYLAQRYTGLSNKEIGERFGGIEASAVSKASARVKEEMALDKKLWKLVTELDSSFKA